MEEIYEKIMREGYGLQLRHGTRTRTGLVCRTDRGLRELKKPRGSTDSLRLAFDVKKRLRENGFANISRCYPTLEGEPFYRQDGTLYILEDVLPQQAARAVYDHFHKGALQVYLAVRLCISKKFFNKY